jgi:hypothetical protein
MMNLNHLFQNEGLDSRSVLVLRHRPMEPDVRRVLPWLAAERPALFNAYQQTQGPNLEKAMLRAKHIASFIGQEPAKALFVGVYAIAGSTPMTREEYWQAYAELKPFGLRGWTEEDPREIQLWFDLQLTDSFASWKGKLVVDWPPPERSWWRWADRNEFPIRAIFEDSALEAAMPDWYQLSLAWEDLGLLPTRWRSALSHWRGIYYVFDASIAKGYVGAAYGNDNLFGRWLNYAATGHGGNRLRRQRDPKTFRFSILQRGSPDMEAEEVVRLEASWKDRLHTRSPFSLNDN